MITKAQLTINVADLNRSITFYENIGFKLEKSYGEYFAEIVAAGLVIGLHPSSKEKLKSDSGNCSIGITTDQFEKIPELLNKLDISFTARTEEGGKFIHFNDPDGNALYFIQPKWS